jgi:hypothetical protein
LASSTGTWTVVFITAAAFNVFAAFLTLFILKPMRLRLNHPKLAANTLATPQDV